MNNFSPLVSIVIPVYNGSNYLAEAIDSALAQTYPNIEILVINDGSKDVGATRNIALSYGDKIRYFEKENGGVATALNLGIEKMNGKYFSWLSHDDKYFADKIEKQINYLSELQKTEVVLYSDVQIINKESKIVSNQRFPHYSPDNFRPAFIKDDVISGCTLLVPKVCFEKCGVFNPELRTTQDYDLWLRISEMYEFYHQIDSLVYSRIHEHQDTKVLKETVIRERDILHFKFLESISIEEIHKFTKGNVAGYYISLAGNMDATHCRNAKDLALKKARNTLFKTGFINSVRNIFRLSVFLFISGLRRLGVIDLVHAILDNFWYNRPISGFLLSTK